MLTFSQIRTDAFTEDHCDFYCERCACEKWGALYIARIEAGLDEPVIEMSGPAGVTSYSPSPYPEASVKTVSGFEMSEIENREGEVLVDSYYSERGETPDWCSAEVMEMYDKLRAENPIECAGSCGRVYTGGAQPWQERNADGSIPKYIRSADDSRWTGI